MFNLKSTKAFVAGVIALAIAIPALVMIYTGRMDVNPTIDRIRAGRKLSHNNDGSIFSNFQRRLPVSTDSQYYREFVHQMNGFPFPGPQRVVIGKRGEVFYTGDHYSTFFRVR